jgi:hypothetical protein
VVTWIVVYALCRQVRARRLARPDEPAGSVRLRRTASGGFEELEG